MKPRALTIAVAAACALFVPPGTTQWASADHATSAIRCGLDLDTAYGPLRRCGQDHGDRGRIGYYSPVTKEYSWDAWQPLVCACLVDGDVTAVDGYRGPVYGYPRLRSATGPTPAARTYGTQYRGAGEDLQGRWGYVDHQTRRFHPTAGWMKAHFTPDPGS
jgi:hypothetical protein